MQYVFKVRICLLISVSPGNYFTNRKQAVWKILPAGVRQKEVFCHRRLHKFLVIRLLGVLRPSSEKSYKPEQDLNMIR